MIFLLIARIPNYQMTRMKNLPTYVEIRVSGFRATPGAPSPEGELEPEHRCSRPKAPPTVA